MTKLKEKNSVPKRVKINSGSLTGIFETTLDMDFDMLENEVIVEKTLLEGSTIQPKFKVETKKESTPF
jgi:Zn finger protein HypA/HybF involved in hydrogenase expression